MNRPTPIWFNRRFHEIPTEWALAGSMGAPQKHWDIGCPKIGVSMCIIIFPDFPQWHCHNLWGTRYFWTKTCERSLLTRFLCHYGFVGSIEGPIWRTQIRSVNAGEVEKRLFFLKTIYCFFNNIFRHFSGKLSGWVRLWANFGPKSIKLTWFFFIKCIQMLLIFMKQQAHTASWRFFSVTTGKKHAKLEIRL